jgi:hypothetical protein
MVALFAVTLAAGQMRWAQELRHRLAIDRLPASRVGLMWRQARVLIGHYKLYIWLAIFVLTLGGLALKAHVTGQTVISAALLTIGLWAVVWIIGTPHYYRPPELRETSDGRHGAVSATGV